MVWFRVDDAFARSRKVLSIPKLRRPGAIGVWTLAGTWAAGELTDGVVPQYAIDDIPGGNKYGSDLILAGLWEKTEDGVRFHDWDHYQPSRVDVLKERADHAARQKAYRDRKQAERDAKRDASRDAAVTPAVTDARPDPTRPDPTTLPTEVLEKDVADAPDLPREDIERICTYLADRIEQNGSNRPTIGKGWRNEARLMLDKDKRTVEQVIGAIDFSQDDSFWRINVLSMPKLREKYDALRLAAIEKANKKPQRGAPTYISGAPGQMRREF